MVSRPGKALSVSDSERLFLGPSDGFHPLTLASGEDDFLRDRVVAAFRAGAHGERSEFRRLEGDDLSAAALAEALGSISMFGESRRIWIREGAKLDRGAEQALVAWASGSGVGVRILLTTSRLVAELKSLQTLAAGATVVSCSPTLAETRRWAERLARDAALALPTGALEAITSRAPNLLALSQEIDKLRLHAGPEGQVSAEAMNALAGGRGSASPERWAAAILRGDTMKSRAEAAALDAEGVGGTGCLWALAERALTALDPSGHSFYRRPPLGEPSLDPSTARRTLHAIYRADRALKRGEIRDAELRDFVEQEIEGARRA